MTRRPLYGSRQPRRSIREFWAIQEELQQKKESPLDADIGEHLRLQPPHYIRNVLFTFSTSSLTKTDRVRFFYALKGRGRKQGTVEQCNGSHLGPGCILVPSRFAGALERFLNSFGSTHQRLDLWVLNPSRKLKIREAFEKEGGKPTL